MILPQRRGVGTAGAAATVLGSPASTTHRQLRHAHNREKTRHEATAAPSYLYKSSKQGHMR